MKKSFEAFGMDEDDANDWATVMSTLALEAYGLKKSLGPKEQASISAKAQELMSSLPENEVKPVIERIRNTMESTLGDMVQKAKTALE